MTDVVVKLHDIDFQTIAPVIQAVPVKIALHCFVFRHQELKGILKRHVIFHGIAPWYEFLPHVVVERQIEERAVHVEHQSR